MNTRVLSILSLTALLGSIGFPAFAENVSTPSARISLLSSKGPAGWVFLVKPSANATGELWRVQGDEWRFPAGLTGYLRTEKSFAHYRLHVEWTYLEKLGNSGIFVAEDEHDAIWPHSYQVNLKTGSAGDLLAQGDLKFSDGSKTLTRKKPANEKPVGEWNTSDITCNGHTITVVVNGVEQNKLTDAPTSDGCIALQLEGAAIAFRNVWVEPLDAHP
ncbi:MAG TPA: DUF1080 domain-containing protein [Opitutaceae bacterium]